MCGSALSYRRPHTVKPLGVVLCRAQRRHAAQAAVDDRVPAREVDDRGRIQLALLRHHRCGIVAWVVGAACNSVDPIQHAAQVSHLENVGKSRGYYHLYTGGLCIPPGHLILDLIVQQFNQISHLTSCEQLGKTGKNHSQSSSPNSEINPIPGPNTNPNFNSNTNPKQQSLQ